jgi:hypothetical protein
VILPASAGQSFSQVDHAPCEAGDWPAARAQLVAAGLSAGGATRGCRELQDFYTLDDAALWVVQGGDKAGHWSVGVLLMRAE